MNKVQEQREWDDAIRRCRLSDEAAGMARELGFGPKSLLKSIPSPQQPWKAPVEEWVRELYAKRERKRLLKARRRAKQEARQVGPAAGQAAGQREQPGGSSTGVEPTT